MKNVLKPRVARHRNGICGYAFHVVLFDHDSDGIVQRPGVSSVARLRLHMVAVVFDEPGNVAVFDVDKLAAGVFAMCENSWRCESFEKELRAAIKRWDKKQFPPLPRKKKPCSKSVAKSTTQKRPKS